MKERLQPYRNLGMIRDLNDLQRAFRELAEIVDIPRNALDEIAGLPAGYSAKVLAQPPVKELGKISQWALLGALGAAFVIVKDKQRSVRVENTQKRIGKHANASHWRNAKALGMMLDMAKAYGSAGGRARWAKMTEAQRKEHQRRAARARWRAHRRRARERAQASALLASTSSGRGRGAERGSTT